MHICREVLYAVVVFELLNIIPTLEMQEFDLQILKTVNLESDLCCQQHLHIPKEFLINIFILYKSFLQLTIESSCIKIFNNNGT